MYEENIEEEVNIKDILTSEEKRGLDARKTGYDSELEIILKEYGQQDRINVDKLDNNIVANIKSIKSIIGNIESDIKLKMSALNLLQKSKGYENILDNAPQIRDSINILNIIIKGMIQQIEFLNVMIEYLNSEKSVVVEKLRITKSSSEFVSLLSERERIQKESFNTLKEFYQESINSMKEEIRLLRARLYGVSEAEKKEEEKIQKEKSEAEKKQRLEEQKKTENEKKEPEKRSLMEDIG